MTDIIVRPKFNEKFIFSYSLGDIKCNFILNALFLNKYDLGALMAYTRNMYDTFYLYVFTLIGLASLVHLILSDEVLMR